MLKKKKRVKRKRRSRRKKKRLRPTSHVLPVFSVLESLRETISEFQEVP